jgi:transcriptional regulator with XRE-family HTH domain
MGPRLIELRRKYRLNQSQLGEICGVSKAAVSQWETGVSTPEIKKLLIIRSKLIFSFDWLITGEGEISSNHGITAVGTERRQRTRRSQYDRRLMDRRDGYDRRQAKGSEEIFS